MPNVDNRRSNQEAWPRWMYFAVPALVIFVVVGLWWALFYQPEGTAITEPTPTRVIAGTQPTQSPTEQATLEAIVPEETTVLPTLPPPTPTEAAVTEVEVEEPTEEEAEPSEPLNIGDTATVCCTSGTGLRMRSGAGTGHPVVKMLTEDTVIEVVGGPQEATGYTWWQIRDEVGTSGWAAAEFLRKQ